MSGLPVLIVGAGVAGLYTAQLLAKQGIASKILEAGDYIGGRCKQSPGFVSWPIDIGGEFVHGSTNLLFDLSVRMGWEPRYLFDVSPHPTPSAKLILNSQLIYLGREKKLLPMHCPDPDVRKMRDLIAGLYELGEDVPDVSLLKYWVDGGMPWRVLGLADALITKTYAANPDLVNAKGYVEEGLAAEELPGCTDNFRLKTTFAPLMEMLKQNVDVSLNWVVQNIDYSAKDSVIVTSAKGESIQGCGVIVTVPVTVWRDGDISYTPPLPQRTVTAAHGLGMSNGMKVILKLRHQIWPKGTTLVICADSFASQVWFDGGDVRDLPNECTVVGFLVGPDAEHIAKMPEHVIVGRLIQQLDDMFGTEAHPNPARVAYQGHLIHDWTTHPYIRGAYSFPKAPGARIELAKPVSSRVYIAGEATCLEAPATIHGAMISAERAVHELLAAVPLSSFAPVKGGISAKL